VFCILLFFFFVIFSFGHGIYLSFDLRSLITPLVSSNCSVFCAVFCEPLFICFYLASVLLMLNNEEGIVISYTPRML